MYKILLVDDETRQLKALANIIQKLRPQYEITLADDGLVAYETISKQDFDIMILDIKMPNLDGLGLLEKLGSKREQLKTVIISGFTEFEYAKKAISYGVQDYIVKPIKKSDIENMLASLENAIAEEGNRLQKEIILKSKLAESLPVYIEHLLNQWVKEKCEKKGLNEIETLFPFKGHGLVLMTSIKGIELMSESELLNLRQELKFKIKELLGKVGHSISFSLEDNKAIMVTIINSEKTFNRSYFENHGRLVDFIDYCSNEMGILVTVSISHLTNNIFDHIQVCFEQAQDAMNRRFFMNREKIIYYNPDQEVVSINNWHTELLEKELYDALSDLDSNLCYQIIQKKAKEQCPPMPQAELKEALLLMMFNLVKVLSKVMEDQKYYMLREHIKHKINSSENYDIMWHNINGLLSKIIEELNTHRKGINGVIIQKCKQFIADNYADDFTLEMMAQKYHFSSAYFGNLFKEYTNLSFSKYLTKVRLENARDLLVHTDLAMSEIAQKVGISDAAYFNRIFKKEFNFSPNKYRQITTQH